jgi:hypothetical protein
VPMRAAGETIQRSTESGVCGSGGQMHEFLGGDMAGVRIFAMDKGIGGRPLRFEYSGMTRVTSGVLQSRQPRGSSI